MARGLLLQVVEDDPSSANDLGVRLADLLRADAALAQRLTEAVDIGANARVIAELLTRLGWPDDPTSPVDSHP